MSSPGTTLRSTRQRAAVKDTLDRARGFKTAQELYAQLRRKGEKIGLSTVYRTLQALAVAGEADVLLNDDGEAIYRLCGADDHHHHLVCRDCGRTVEIKSDSLERWAHETAREHGFSAVTHTAELYGVCGDCTTK